MDYFNKFVLYTIIWWLTFFAVLPFWTRPVVDPRATSGGWVGHPERPMLVRKLVVTTAISAVIWALACAVIASGWISFHTGWWALPND